MAIPDITCDLCMYGSKEVERVGVCCEHLCRLLFPCVVTVDVEGLDV